VPGAPGAPALPPGSDDGGSDLDSDDGGTSS
jgi:hypothetical protein